MGDKVKVGTLEMKTYAAEKPIAISPTGTFLKPADVLGKADLAFGSLLSLDDNTQTKLAVERTRLEPDFRLSLVGVGSFTKDEVLEHMETGTEFGRGFVHAEVNYCNELMTSLAQNTPRSTWPEMPTTPPMPVPKEWEWVPKPYARFCRTIALFCENNTDNVTTPAAKYRMNNVHPVFAKMGFIVKCLTGVHDVRAEFATIARNRRVVYISGIGHGSPTAYTGHLGNRILEVGQYDPAEVKGKATHLLSCQTAKQLGPDLVKNGCHAYAGYFENFIFAWDSPSTPINEQDLFWRADSTFDINMAMGRTAEEAAKAAIAAFNAAIAQVPNTIYATYLTHDRNYLRTPFHDAIYGEKNHRIYAWIRLPMTPFMEAEETMPELVEEKAVATA